MSGPDLIITLSYFYFKLQLFYEESKKEYILQVVISKVQSEKQKSYERIYIHQDLRVFSIT